NPAIMNPKHKGKEFNFVGNNSVFIGFNKLPGCSCVVTPSIIITIVKNIVDTNPRNDTYERYLISISVNGTKTAQEIIFSNSRDTLGNNTYKESPIRVMKAIAIPISSNKNNNDNPIIHPEYLNAKGNERDPTPK
ncbi:29042_t:CDS:2, partial [Gigaspora margarita]